MRSFKPSKIRHYLGAPLLDSFDGLKYVIAQYIVSIYQKGKLGFDKPIKINVGLIASITDLLNQGPLVLVGLK